MNNKGKRRAEPFYLSPKTSGAGYIQYNLHIGGILFQPLAHRLVLLAFGNILGILPWAAYASGIFALAVTAGGLSLKSRVALAIALPTMHLSWGFGFIKGFISGAGTTSDKGRLSGKAAGK